jgi:hypothetical protein
MYCTQCGATLSGSAKFCRQCGVRLDESIQASSSVGYAPTPPASSVPSSTGAQKRYRRPVVFRAVACVLIAAMSISAAVKLLPGGISVSGGGSPTSVDKGRREEAQTVSVGIDNPVVSAAGVTVNVNELNLTDGDTTLTVQRYEQKLGEDGFLGVEYDIALGNRHYLRAPLTVTLPYDANAARGSEVCVLHYDSDYGEWIPQETELNAETGTVSVKLTSLSPVRLVYFNKDYSRSLYYIANNGHSNATLEVSYNYWTHIKNTPREPARIVAQDYITNGNTISSTQWLNQAGDAAISSVNTYYTLFGALADTVYASVNTLATAGGAVKNVTDKASKGIGILSLTIAATQLMYDLQTKDSTGPQNETAINLYKNIATNGGTLYSFCTGYSSAALSMGFLAVAATGYMLDTLVEEAKTIQADTVEAVFDTYYSEHSTFNERDLYNIFVDAYWDAWQNNRDSQDGMDYAIQKITDAIDAHAEKFWDDVYRGGSDALTFAVADAGKNNFYTPAAEQKRELTARFKEDMFARFNSKVIPWINEFMHERMQDAIYSSLKLTADPYNRYHRVQIQEIAPEGGKEVCKYKMCPIRFGSANDFVRTEYPEEWELLAPEGDKEWAVKLDFTLLGYIMASAPDKVLLFDAWDEEKRFGGQIATETLTLTGEEAGYTTLIDLSSAGGAGSFTSFETFIREINPNQYRDYSGMFPLLVRDSLMSAGRIEMTHLGGNKYSFTVPAFEVEGISDKILNHKSSLSSMTFTGTMDANMTTGTFEATVIPNAVCVYTYGDRIQTAEYEGISITITMELDRNHQNSRHLTSRCVYTYLNVYGHFENCETHFPNMSINTYSD